MITFEKRMVYTTPIGESSLPDLVRKENPHLKSRLDFYDELFAGYGHVASCFPYRQQDRYTRELTARETDVCVLENEFLRAEFLPGYGGRLWSLYDKKAQRELFYKSEVIRICNLAVRNAWFAGGVEWNCGVVGHSPMTVSPMHTVTYQTGDGLPVLRMYQFERIRRVVFQMDFYLKAALLFCRIKIINPHDHVVPMYWWSTAAVRSGEAARVVTRAESAYSKEALFTGAIYKTGVPIHDGVDVTYPSRIPRITDYFWRVPDEARKYICAFDEEGRGVMQTSTDRLKGRKIFSWGMRPGAKRWQQFLAGDNEDGSYFEMQAGLARTQYECLPMPPRSNWEWLEVYGAVSADKQKIHGSWSDAAAETERQIERLIPQKQLEEELIATRDTIGDRAAGRPVLSGGGFGALDLLLCDEKAYAHLDFGQTGEEQSDWLHLLRHGFMPEKEPETPPSSWMNQPEWTELLEKAAANADQYNWYTHLHLGVCHLHSGLADKAEQHLSRSVTLKPSCWALCALAELARGRGDLDTYAALCHKATMLKPGDISVTVHGMRAQIEAGCHETALTLYASCSPEIRSLGRVRLYASLAYAALGRTEEAEELLLAGGGLIVPDIREGEVSVTDLWMQIEQAKRGNAVSRETLSPPLDFDFRV